LNVPIIFVKVWIPNIINVINLEALLNIMNIILFYIINLRLSKCFLIVIVKIFYVQRVQNMLKILWK